MALMSCLPVIAFSTEIHCIPYFERPHKCITVLCHYSINHGFCNERF